MTERSGPRPRAVLLGMAVTRSTVALLVAVVALGALVGLAVLNWLEQMT